MVNPAFIPAAAGTAARLGPWLARAAKSNAAFIPSLVTKLRSAGVVVGNKVEDIIDAFKRSPGTALTILGTIASLGYAVKDLIGQGKEDEHLHQHRETLERIALGVSPAEREAAFMRLFAIGERQFDSSLSISSADAERNEAVRQVLQWARGHYGSPEAAMRAHTMAQAFFELDARTVQIGFATLRL